MKLKNACNGFSDGFIGLSVPYNHIEYGLEFKVNSSSGSGRLFL
ncbi:hypothetical protein [Chryseobacterium gallinarum]|nr:hypothetical protein [Chryseobacterium gallinarum]